MVNISHCKKLAGFYNSFKMLILIIFLVACRNSSNHSNSRIISEDIIKKEFDIENFLSKAEQQKEFNIIHFEEDQFPLIVEYIDHSIRTQSKIQTLGTDEIYYSEELIPDPPGSVKEYFEYDEKGQITMYYQSTIPGNLKLQQIDFKNGRIVNDENLESRYFNCGFDLYSLYSLLKEKKLLNLSLDSSEEIWVQQYLDEKNISKEQFAKENQLYQADRNHIHIEFLNNSWIVKKSYQKNQYYKGNEISMIFVNAKTGRIIREYLAYENLKK